MGSVKEEHYFMIKISIVLFLRCFLDDVRGHFYAHGCKIIFLAMLKSMLNLNVILLLREKMEMEINGLFLVRPTFFPLKIALKKTFFTRKK